MRSSGYDRRSATVTRASPKPACTSSPESREGSSPPDVTRTELTCALGLGHDVARHAVSAREAPILPWTREARGEIRR